MDEKYTSYNSIALAQDPDFISWVKSPDEVNLTHLVDWINAHPEKTDLVQEAKKIVLSIVVDEGSDFDNSQVNQLWNRIDTSISKPATKTTSTIKTLRWIALAAAACLALLIANRLMNPTTTIDSPIAKHIEHRLPDGSEVILNAGSSIQYSDKKWEDHRSLKLKGEAFFKVKKGETFIVNTQLGKVEVLGTSFNIKARGEKMNVQCFTGKVKVSSGKSQEILSPGTEVTTNRQNQMTNPTTFEKLEAPLWQKGVFQFDKEPLVNVFKEFERQFNVTIQAPALILEKEANVFFETGNLDSALYNICWPMQLKYEIEGNTIQISE